MNSTDGFVKIIVAMTSKNVIGRGNKLPWIQVHKGDLKRFKEVTMGSTIVMGRKTFESFGSRPLPGRTNVVISRTLDTVPDGVILARDLEYYLQAHTEDKIWIIGGGDIYKQALDLNVVSEVDVTWIPEDIDPEGCVLFPKLIDDSVIDNAPWEKLFLTIHPYNPGLMLQTFRNARHPAC